MFSIRVARVVAGQGNGLTRAKIGSMKPRGTTSRSSTTWAPSRALRFPSSRQVVAGIPCQKILVKPESACMLSALARRSFPRKHVQDIQNCILGRPTFERGVDFLSCLQASVMVTPPKAGKVKRTATAYTMSRRSSNVCVPRTAVMTSANDSRPESGRRGSCRRSPRSPLYRETGKTSAPTCRGCASSAPFVPIAFSSRLRPTCPTISGPNSLIRRRSI